jgi:hypothetical protein
MRDMETHADRQQQPQKVFYTQPPQGWIVSIALDVISNEEVITDDGLSQFVQDRVGVHREQSMTHQISNWSAGVSMFNPKWLEQFFLPKIDKRPTPVKQLNVTIMVISMFFAGEFTSQIPGSVVLLPATSSSHSRVGSTQKWLEELTKHSRCPIDIAMIKELIIKSHLIATGKAGFPDPNLKDLWIVSSPQPSQPDDTSFVSTAEDPPQFQKTQPLEELDLNQEDAMPLNLSQSQRQQLVRNPSRLSVSSSSPL